MPLRITRAPTNQVLWERCVERFLADAASPGPRDRVAWLWLSHRNLRARLLEVAEARGLEGWLDPPITFFGDLTRLFDLREKPVGLLTRRRIVSRLAAKMGREILGREPGRADGVIRGHMLDAVLADLLPEGVTPDELGGALAGLEGDEFARRRDRWVVAVYRAYLRELEARGVRDWRSANARIAERIEAGELRAVLRGATRLHVYGITSVRTRRRLLRALAGQDEVRVDLYLPLESEPDGYLDGLTEDVEVVGVRGVEGRAGDGAGPADVQLALPIERARSDVERPPPHVQPAPDAAREMSWVAREVKRLLAAGEAEPHEVAVVARSGREDTRRALWALERAGVPVTARIRTPLSEIAVLKALLLVLRGAGRSWDYRSLRAVLDHAYLDTKVDLRGIDFIAGRRRVRGLAAWEEKLEQVLRLVSENARETRGEGLFADRLQKDLEALRAVREALEPLSESRTEPEWIDLTLRLLGEERGLFFLRRRVCDPVADRWDVVRLDQRGIVLLERLLREWRELDHPDEPLEPAAWHALLRRLLETNELVLSTPAQKGVQVLEAHDAALVPFAHTFVVHANDGEFPRVAGSTGVFSHEERARLAERGIPLTHRDDELRRERTLWRAVTGQAAGVRISYRTTDPGGTPLLPSLMVPEHDPETELPRVRTPRDEREPVSPAEADRRAAYVLHERSGGAAAGTGTGDGAPLVRVAPARPDRLRQAIVAAVAESHRGPGLERSPAPEAHPALVPNPWSGRLRDPDVLRVLEERFDEGYTWSASQLELYARAPFTFLVDRVLRLRGLEEAEEETTPLTFGGVAHEILERFYRERLDALPAALDEAAAARLEEIAREVYAAREEAGEWLGLPALWATSRETVWESVRGYVAWELAHVAEKGERPVHVELEFGYDDEAVLLEGTDVHGRPARLRVRGRIDRVDAAGTSRPVHHVLDYKSGRTPGKNDFEDATVLQGALYMEVVASRGLEVRSCRYRSIRNPGRPQNGGMITYGSDAHAHAMSLAFAIPARVRAGRFEPVASRKGGWQSWDPGLEIRRCSVRLEEGHRFERAPDVATGEPGGAGRADG